MNIFTDEDIKEIVGPWGDTPIKGYTRSLFDKIEAKLREKQGVNTLRDAAQQALGALKIAQDDCLHGEMAEPSPIFEEAITALETALAEPQPEPVAMLWKIRKALALASAICDRVPTRWHYTHEIGSAEADIGDMVNAHPDGTHGYRLIQEAEAELVAYLTTPEAAPPRREGVSLTGIDEIEDCWPEGGEVDPEGRGMIVSAQWLYDFARAIEAALKERNT